MKFKVWDYRKEEFNYHLDFCMKTDGVLWIVSEGIPIFQANKRFKIVYSTGQTTKTGVEIYQGNIIKGNIIEHSIGTMGAIEYSLEYSAYVNRNKAGDTLLLKIDGIEIIGNKFENPELLEEAIRDRVNKEVEEKFAPCPNCPKPRVYNGHVFTTSCPHCGDEIPF